MHVFVLDVERLAADTGQLGRSRNDTECMIDAPSDDSQINGGTSAINRPVAAPVPKAPKGRRGRGPARELVAVEPDDIAGRRYNLGDEITVGRAAGCHVTVDDNYVSQLHARIFNRDGQLFVEDLG